MKKSLSVKNRIIGFLMTTVLVLSVMLTAPASPFTITAHADTTEDDTVTKSVLLKTSMGTYGEAGYYSSEFYTSLDYNDSWLTVEDKSVYNYGVAKFAVILSSAIYPGISCMIDSPNYTADKAAILDAFGFIDTELYSISNSSGLITSEDGYIYINDEAIPDDELSDDELSDDAFVTETTTADESSADVDSSDEEDATTIVIGHKPVIVDGESHDVYVIVIRGTMGAAEWESNYDVGNTSEEYIEKTGEHPEWTDYDNHKGFDVVANRVQTLLDTYTSKHMTTGASADYLITGHSRGAGIANILGAKLEAAGYNSCAYTYASPNTTTNPGKYPARTVFNIINSNDFITTLPLAEWGFARYGTDLAVDIANDDITRTIADKSMEMTYVGKAPTFLTDAFNGFTSSRDELYTDETFECTYDTLDEKNTAFTATASAIDYLRLGNFISIEDCSGTNADGKYYFKETLSVGAFMVGLSRIMSDQANFFSMFLTINHLNNVFPKDSIYTDALNTFMNALTSNLIESFYPHMTTCYYAIVEGINEKDLANAAVSSDTIDTAQVQDMLPTGTVSDKAPFVGSAGFYVMISAIVAATAAIIAILVIRKKKQAKSE